AVPGGLLATVALLFGTHEAVAAPCPRGKKRCRQRCIPKRQCCTNGNCRPGVTGKVCRRGRCVCRPGTRRCRGRCIPATRCCTSATCGAGRECVKGACLCATGSVPCNGGCCEICGPASDGVCAPQCHPEATVLSACDGGRCCACGSSLSRMQCNGRCVDICPPGPRYNDACQCVPG